MNKFISIGGTLFAHIETDKPDDNYFEPTSSSSSSSSSSGGGCFTLPPGSSNTLIYFLLFVILLSLADEVRRQKVFLRRPGDKIAVIAIALVFTFETSPVFVKKAETATWGYTPHRAGYSGTYYYLTDHQGGHN